MFLSTLTVFVVAATPPLESWQRDEEGVQITDDERQALERAFTLAKP